MEETKDKSQKLIKCPVCNGTPWKIIDEGKYTSMKICTFCYGKSFLDWCDIIGGVDKGWLEIELNKTRKIINGIVE